MRVNGKRTIVENLDVEIDEFTVLQNIYQKWLPKRFAYIYEGHWYREDGFDYHKREDLYVKDRPATQEELDFLNAYQKVVAFVKSNNYHT